MENFDGRHVSNWRCQLIGDIEHSKLIYTTFSTFEIFRYSITKFTRVRKLVSYNYLYIIKIRHSSKRNECFTLHACVYLLRAKARARMYHKNLSMASILAIQSFYKKPCYYGQQCYNVIKRAVCSPSLLNNSILLEVRP